MTTLSLNTSLIAAGQTIDPSDVINPLNELLGHIEDVIDGVYEFSPFAISVGDELTIVSGAITVNAGYHTVDTEAATASDELTTVNGGAEGRVVLLRQANAAREIEVRHADGNIRLAGGNDIVLGWNGILLLIYDVTDATWYGGKLGGGFVHLQAPDEVTISGGIITVDRNYHHVDTEADAASDNLDTINGGVLVGQLLSIRPISTSRTVVIKHATGNIYNSAGADVTLDETWKVWTGLYTATGWLQIGGPAS